MTIDYAREIVKNDPYYTVTQVREAEGFIAGYENREKEIEKLKSNGER